MLRMWTYDIAREQSPTLDHLRLFCRVTEEAGFDAIGLYLEHRFAYPSTPWSHGTGCVTPERVRTLQSEFPSLQIVPFVNLLGHFEGMLYTEIGKRFRDELFQGLQACPSKPDFVDLCEKMLDDVMNCFDSELIHIGGDETWQLGACPVCKEKVEGTEVPGDKGRDGKAELYGRHFGPLADRVKESGRRPAIWGDMFRDHPSALDYFPKETLIFDWQYFGGVRETAKPFLDKGFEVVACPALHTYNATWLHIPQSEENVLQIATDAVELGLHGVCVTTWECGLFGAYDTLIPALRASGKILTDPQSTVPNTQPTFLACYLQDSERFEEWARLMGIELQECGGTFAFSGIRSSLKCRLLLYANPFLAWMHHGEELTGEVGDKALDVFERAFAVAPNEAAKDLTLFARSAVEFVRITEGARKEYAKGNAEAAVGKLSLTRRLFDDLEHAAIRTKKRIGGSLADIERCKVAKRHVETVIQKIRQYGDGSLGYLPAFEIITHPKFIPHDQASWWLINRWANQ